MDMKLTLQVNIIICSRSMLRVSIVTCMWQRYARPCKYSAWIYLIYDRIHVHALRVRYAHHQTFYNDFVTCIAHMSSVSQAFNQLLINRKVGALYWRRIIWQWQRINRHAHYCSSWDNALLSLANFEAILHTCRYNLMYSFDSHVHLKVTMASSPVETTKLG